MSKSVPFRLTDALVLLFMSVLAGAGAAREQAGGVRPAHGEPPAPKDYPRSHLLVETEHLAGLLSGAGGGVSADKLVLIDARRYDPYADGHIPGALNIESDPLQAPKNPPFFLPESDHVGKLAKVCGIDADSRVVIYDGNAGRLAARVWFVLWAYGHEGVSILNGGIDKWAAEKREISDKALAKAKRSGSWKPKERPRNVCTYAQLKGYRPPPAPPGQIPLSTHDGVDGDHLLEASERVHFIQPG